jgi:hypothetical protein
MGLNESTVLIRQKLCTYSLSLLIFTTIYQDKATIQSDFYYTTASCLVYTYIPNTILLVNL